MKVSISRPGPAMGRNRCATWVLPLSTALLALAFGIPLRSQEATAPAESVADAARAARDQKTSAAKPTKVITTDDLVPPTPLPVESIGPAAPSKTPTSQMASKPQGAQAGLNKPSNEAARAQAEEPAAQKTNCDDPNDERRRAELQALQDERDQLRRELNADPPVISGRDVDMTNFKTGNSGVAFGSPPLSQTTPQSPARIQEVELNERIASLERAIRIACDSPENAGIQRKLDEALQQLKMLQREFDLDRTTYYSKPNYSDDTAGKAKLAEEQQQIDAVQSEVDRLKQELAAQPSEE